MNRFTMKKVLIFGMLLMLYLQGSIHAETPVTGTVRGTSHAIVISAEEPAGNETKIAFPSFSYRINLLLYFVTPVFIFVLLLMIKIRQLNRDGQNGSHYADSFS
jgi:hypothetical protein